jgi:protocatechuate 3,4-dioxygenase beta subunit
VAAPGAPAAAHPPTASEALTAVAPRSQSLRVCIVISACRSSGAGDTLRGLGGFACPADRTSEEGLMTMYTVSRRQILGLTLGAAGVAISGRFGAAFAEALKRTPGEILGPFYPVIKRVDQGADLTVIPGKPGRATGQVLHVMGRVLNVEGQPVRGARVELWQANSHGRYTHPSDTNPAPLDPNFEGFAIQNTDAEGRYRFKTIKPGAYPATADWMRPPHLHFEVTGKVNRLVTQMYFPGEPLNDKDVLLQQLRNNRDGAIAKVLPPTADVEPDSRLVVWDIVLDKG